MIDFEIEHVSNSTAIVKVRGTLNESTREYFFDCISDLLGDDEKTAGRIKNVIIECNGLGFMSSSGMAALLTSRKKANRRGSKIYLTHLNSTIATALKFTKLSSLLAVYPTTAELLKKLKVCDPIGC